MVGLDSQRGDEIERFAGYDLIRTWSAQSFRLKLYDTYRTDQEGKTILAYELFDDEHGSGPVFRGEDFHCSPLHSIDSDRTIASLLTFLSLKPGDTDPEHFEGYSTQQLDWCRSRGEQLAFLAHELDQPYRPLHDAAIDHESWEDAHKAGRFNRALTLTYSLDGTAYRVGLQAGETDHVEVLTDGESAYVLTTNFRLQYIGLEIFTDGEQTGEVFLDDGKLEDTLGGDVWSLSSSRLIEKLLAHASEGSPPPPFRSEGKRVEEHLEGLSDDVRQQIRGFLALGRRNAWIREAWDPPFTALSFHVCADVDELAEKILRGNWCLGQAFVLGDICFINQVDGGDEWLTIKGSTPFESITMKTFNETLEQASERLRTTIRRIQDASEEECRRLEY